MKKSIFFTILLVLTLAASANAASAGFHWNPNSEPDIDGYRIYYGISSGVYEGFAWVEHETCSTQCSGTVDGLVEGQTYYFAFTAVDEAGQESGHSYEIVSAAGALFSVGGFSLDEIIYNENLPSGVYRITVNADGTYTIEPLGNSAPVVSITASATEIIEGNEVTVTASASDSEGDPLIYSWYVDGALDFADNNSESWENLSVGSHTIYCVVDDGQGNAVQSNTVTVTVLAGPHISVPEILVINATYGDATASGSIAVANLGNGDMYWTASTTSGMLSLSPNSGVNSGSVGVIADLTGLDPGDYYGDLFITSSDADNSPQTVPVMVTIADVVENTASIDLSGNAYLSIADTSQSGLDITGNFSMEARIKLKQLPSTIGTGRAMISKDSNTVGGRSYIFMITSADQARIIWWNAAGHISYFNMDTAFMPSDIGNWINIAVTADVSVPSVTFYKNNSLMSDTAVSILATAIHDSPTVFQIGARTLAVGTEIYFDGIGFIDEARVWNDIRTAMEIGDNCQKELVGTEANLVGYWKFNNDLSDSAGNGNTLTNNGGAVFSTDVPQ